MLKEAGVISTVYAVNIGLLAEKRHAYEDAVAEAQSKLDAFPISKASASKEAATERRALVRKRNQAQAALHFYEERSRQDLRNLINIVRKWAERKEGHALDWLTALWDIACKSRRWDQRENRRLNTGSIAFYTFPQYLVDMIVERTGGRPITVALKASTSKEAANERRALVRKRNQAQAALHFYEERSRQDLRNLINIVRKWAERKEDHALDWL